MSLEYGNKIPLRRSVGKILVLFEIFHWLEKKWKEKAWITDLLNFSTLKRRLWCLAVLHKSFGSVKLVACVFIVSLVQSTSRDNSLLISFTVVLIFDLSLLGTKSKSEWSVERKEVKDWSYYFALFQTT